MSCIPTQTDTHTHTQWNNSHKKEWNYAVCNNMDGPRDYQDKWSKRDRERKIPYDIAYVESKEWHNEVIYKTEMDSQT